MSKFKVDGVPRKNISKLPSNVSKLKTDTCKRLTQRAIALGTTILSALPVALPANAQPYSRNAKVGDIYCSRQPPGSNQMVCEQYKGQEGEKEVFRGQLKNNEYVVPSFVDSHIDPNQLQDSLGFPQKAEEPPQQPPQFQSFPWPSIPFFWQNENH